MFTLEQKVDLILRYIATTDNAKRAQLKKLVVQALNSDGDVVPATPTVDDMIHDLLKALGMPQHLKGYDYVTKALKICVLDPSYVSGITYHLYPDIAHLFNTSDKAVERAIRRTIDVTFDKGDIDNITRFFGNTIDVDSGKVTSREFIIACYNDIVRRMKKYGVKA
jgi:two-component system response regulator (stage 0 sporulation protein A)